MAKIGDLFNAGTPVRVSGVYVCTGCTRAFTATVIGAPLPPAHHNGARWKLVKISPKAEGAPHPASKENAAGPEPKVSAQPDSPSEIPAQSPSGNVTSSKPA